jgi:hypothetical protein
VGQAGPYIIDAGISSSRRIAEFWGLLPAAASKPEPKPAPARMPPSPQPALPQIEEALAKASARSGQAQAVEGVIRRALKAAGLLR